MMQIQPLSNAAYSFIRFVVTWNQRFYRTTLCVSAVFAVARCLSARLSITLVYLDGWRYRQTSFSIR